MNLHTFEKLKEGAVDSMHNHLIHTEHVPTTRTHSFADEEALSIKAKIEKRKQKQKKLKRIIFGVGGVLFFLVALVVYSQYRLYVLTNEEAKVSSGVIPSSVAQSSATSTTMTGEEIVRALGKHILLPRGNPQIAEVKDVEKLKATQAFFKNAENGDVVVVYESTIFLYRPSIDIVVASGDISGLGETKP